MYDIFATYWEGPGNGDDGGSGTDCDDANPGNPPAPLLAIEDGVVDLVSDSPDAGDGAPEIADDGYGALARVEAPTETPGGYRDPLSPAPSSIPDAGAPSPMPPPTSASKSAILKEIQRVRPLAETC